MTEATGTTTTSRTLSTIRAIDGTTSALILVVLAVLMVQVGAAFGKTLFDELGPFGASFVRLASSAIILLAVYRPRLTGRSREQILAVIGFGLAVALMCSTFYAAVERLPLGIAVTIQFIGPLGVAVVGSRTRLDVVWVGLAAIGLLLLNPPGGAALDGLGVFWALVAAAGWIGYIYLGKRVGRVMSVGEGLALAFAVAAVALAPIGIAEAGPALLDARLLAAGAAVGLLSSVIPFTLELHALRRLRPGVYGILMSLEPAFGAASGLVVLGERLEALVVLGIALVVTASIGVVRGERAREARQTQRG